MNDDVRGPIDEQLYAPATNNRLSLPPVASALPIGIFTASVLFDVLSLVADSAEHARTYHRRALELLKVGLGASLAALALSVVDSLRVPAGSSVGDSATKQLAVDGALAAVYLLNVAAREKQLADAPGVETGLQPGPIGLSLAGLALLGAAGKVK